MTIDLTAVARHARVATIYILLAWLFGLMPPPGTRLFLVVLFAVACVADQWLTQQQPTRVVRIPTARTKTAA
ncbi:hypothetical protein [Streptomyces zhihengii]